jgi:tryptophanyl-tRNA synthetase
MTMLYLNFVTVARLERNPTIKDEIQLRGFGRDIPAEFLCYPAAQAADINAFKATVVPVGEDQAPLIEQSNEIIRGAVARLVGIRVGVVSGVFNLESPSVDAPGWRLRHEAAYHAA